MRKFVMAMLCALVLAPGLASASTPSEGVPLAVRRGFFTETDIGALFTVGGFDGYSNWAAYLQLGLGYSIPVPITANGSLIDIGVHVGIGANAQSCFTTRNAAGDCVGGERAPDSAKAVADNFTMTSIDVTGAILFGVAERLYLGPKLNVGYTLLDPAPDLAGTRGGVNAGIGLSLEYATNMDHFSVGVDSTIRYIIGPNILSVQPIFARVKYTF